MTRTLLQRKKATLARAVKGRCVRPLRMGNSELFFFLFLFLFWIDWGDFEIANRSFCLEGGEKTLFLISKKTTMEKKQKKLSQQLFFFIFHLSFQLFKPSR